MSNSSQVFIIGGHAGAGKSLTASILESYCHRRGYIIHRLHFASPLKQLLNSVGISKPHYADANIAERLKNKGITKYSQFVEHLTKNFSKLPFIDLFENAPEKFRTELEIAKLELPFSMLLVNENPLNAFRLLIQEIGEAIKRATSEYYYATVLYYTIYKLMQASLRGINTVYIVDDYRFPYEHLGTLLEYLDDEPQFSLELKDKLAELQSVTKLNYIIVDAPLKLIRQRLNITKKEHQKWLKHSSEAFIPELYRDMTINNNYETKDEFLNYLVEQVFPTLVK